MQGDIAARLPRARSGSTTQAAERRLIIAICVGLFVFTFCVYWSLGPGNTDYAHQVNQATDLIHGHLDFLPQYTRNPETLERSNYDGTGFCYLPGDPQIGTVPDARIDTNCKTYMQYSLGPAFIVVPGVLIWGNSLNQTLVSTIFGAMTAPIVFLIAARFSSKRSTQLLLTALMMFGTIFWFAASNGGVWYFAHTTATFFIFAAIYFVVARPQPLLAGAMLGAAFLCRPTMLATGMFFVIAFSPLWLRRPGENGGRWGINLGPVLSFAAGLAPFLAVEGLVNYLRFDNPLETGYGYTEQARQTYQQALYPHGLFDVRYITRHPPIALEAMPVFNQPGADCGNGLDCAPIMVSYNGLAIWATTPIFLTTMFTGVTNRWVTRVGAALVALACLVILSRAISHAWSSGWETADIPFGVQLLPFWAMISAAVFFALRNRDRLVAACWAAIIPTALGIFVFAATGWAQFGYRYALDFTPFLWLLVAIFIGDNLKPWHVALIVAGIAINLMGVLWIYHFDMSHLGGLSWIDSGQRYG